VTYHNTSGRATVFDMDIDISNRYIATVSGERRLNVFHIDTGKNVRSYKSDTPDEVNIQDQGSLLKISLDPGGVHAVTGGSDKSIRLFDFSNGNILGKVLGHSELITGVKFTPDCERIISTSADGCIFVWKVSDELVTKMRQKWLDRSGVLGQSAERNSPYLSPTSTPILTPMSTSPPTIQPRTTMPAQRPQSLIMDLTNDGANRQDLEFTVKKRPIKAKKSLGSLTPAALQAEESSKKLKRPASFANDNIEHLKSTQVTPPPRPVSEFSPTSPKSSEFSNSRLPQPTSPPPRPTVFIADGLNTPPNTPSSPNFAKKDSWKLGLPNWAKKAFKEKEEEKEKHKKSANMSVTIVSEPVDMDKQLPAIPGKPISKVKSRSKLRQDSTKSMLGVDPDDTNDNSLSDNASFDESSPSFSSNQPPPMIEDDSGGDVDADDDDDDNIYSPEENTGSDNEDNETIYIESQVDETVDDNDNRKRRKGSFVGSIKVMELDDRSKSPSGSDKDIEDINCEEEEREEEEDVESGEDNAKKLEMYLQTPVQSCFGENIHNGQNSEENADQDTVSKKRLSFTTKFYSEGHRESSTFNNERNSLVDALTKIMGNPEENDIVTEEDSKDANRNDGVEKALEALEVRTDEMVSKEYEANTEDEQRQLPSSSNTTTIKNSGKEVSSSPSLSTLNKVEQVKQDENETTIKKMDEKGDGLGIIVHDKTIDNASDTDGNNNFFFLYIYYSK
jgi:hypothetical protein